MEVMRLVRRKGVEIKVVGHYATINGERVPIDPLKSNLPDRCKLAVAEMVTGRKFELVEAV
jgi:hypothetical protein